MILCSKISQMIEGNGDRHLIQIRNGKRLIVWPRHIAEAKVLPMPKWEDRGEEVAGC